jgi:hypothetical protein
MGIYIQLESRDIEGDMEIEQMAGTIGQNILREAVIHRWPLSLYLIGINKTASNY